MKLRHVMIFGLAALLAACGQKTETDETGAAGMTAETGMTNDMSGMGNMTTPAEAGAKMANGSGIVTVVDKVEGSITIDHGPIPEANWPAMTMAFKARPELLDSVTAGDKVTFELALKDGAGEVTAITKQ